MSRAYRVQVQESLKKILRAEDHVSCQLELLEILPCEQMAELLASELAKLGFDIEGETATRTDKEVTITVDLPSATVVVAAVSDKAVNLQVTRAGRVYEEEGSQQVREAALRAEARGELETKSKQAEALLQREVTDRLESRLGDIRQELEAAANRATAAALKVRAAQLGQIKSISEDPEVGSLTIVVEV